MTTPNMEAETAQAEIPGKVAKALGAQLVNGALAAEILPVYVSFQRRLPRTVISNLSPHAARESTERVRSSLQVAGVDYPRTRVIVNLGPTPAPVRSGPLLDLPMALAVWAADCEGLATAAGTVGRRTVFVGELSLSGEVRAPSRGLVAIAEACLREDYALACSRDAIPMVAHLDGLRVYPLLTLMDAMQVWIGARHPVTMHEEVLPTSATDPAWGRVRQNWIGVEPLIEQALRALAEDRPILVAGSRACSFAKLVGLAGPPPKDDAAVRRVQSAAGLSVVGGRPFSVVGGRPFRAPHHTVTLGAMVGDLSHPGELSLASGGTLLVDDAREWPLATLRGVIGAWISGVVSGTKGNRPALFDLIFTVEPGQLASMFSRLQGYLGEFEGPRPREIEVIVLPD